MSGSRWLNWTPRRMSGLSQQKLYGVVAAAVSNSPDLLGLRVIASAVKGATAEVSAFGLSTKTSTCQV
jgi:hypothetical protein